MDNNALLASTLIGALQTQVAALGIPVQPVLSGPLAQLPSNLLLGQIYMATDQPSVFIGTPGTAPGYLQFQIQAAAQLGVDVLAQAENFVPMEDFEVPTFLGGSG